MIINKTNLQKEGMTNQEREKKTVQKKNKTHSLHPFVCLHTEKDFFSGDISSHIQQNE